MCIEQTVEAMQMMRVLWGGVGAEQQSDTSDTSEKQIVSTVVAYYISLLLELAFLCIPPPN